MFVEHKIIPPSGDGPSNIRRAELQLLRDLFGFSGYVGISKKIVFTEGQRAGADRKTFVNIFPELSDEIRIIPVGSSTNLPGINRAVLSLLESDFARCDFFLIRDRDYLSQAAVSKYKNQSPRLFILDRHEIENYLLDEEVIAQKSQGASVYITLQHKFVSSCLR